MATKARMHSIFSLAGGRNCGIHSGSEWPGFFAEDTLAKVCFVQKFMVSREVLSSIKIWRFWRLQETLIGTRTASRLWQEFSCDKFVLNAFKRIWRHFWIWNSTGTSRVPIRCWNLSVYGGAGQRHPCDSGCRQVWKRTYKILHAQRSAWKRFVFCSSSQVSDTSNSVATLSRFGSQGDNKTLYWSVVRETLAGKPDCTTDQNWSLNQAAAAAALKPSWNGVNIVQCNTHGGANNKIGH